MSSIGPQLPPHLQKRKRSPTDDGHSKAPAHKVTQQKNDDEIVLDGGDSSDDDYGPHTAPAGHSATGAPALKEAPREISASSGQALGPSLPQAPQNEDEIALSDSDSDSQTGPAHLKGPDGVTQPSPPPRRIIGPAPPPAPLSERPSIPTSDSSDSESDYGPAPPTAGTTSAPTARPASDFHAAAPQPAPPKRDDWMLAPPSGPSSGSAPDISKLKQPRKFASGRAAAAAAAHAGGVSSIWTETPEEKARRLADAVLGRGPAAPDAGPAADRRRGEGAGGADAERIRSYTEQTRGKSLYEEHQARKKAGDGKRERAGGEDEDDPSKRAFNWEKDMKAGASISHAQRKELVNKSADFGGRFQKGSFL